MKNILSILLILFCTMIFAEDGIRFEEKATWQQILDKAKKENKFILVDCYTTWCGPCKKGLNNMAELYDEWKEKYNFQIIAVSTDDARSVAKVKPYVEAQRWDYEVLLDTNEELKRSRVAGKRRATSR